MAQQEAMFYECLDFFRDFAVVARIIVAWVSANILLKPSAGMVAYRLKLREKRVS